MLANVDMLVDYGEDFTDAATVVENLQTTYQVGKGMLEHLKSLAADEETPAGLPDDAEEPMALAPQPEEPPAEPEIAAAAPNAAQTAEAGRDADAEDEAADAPLTRRRMRFEFT